MGTPSEVVWHTYASAAMRVRSSPRTIRNWRQNGMPMEWRADGTGRRVRAVREDVPLGWWRDRMNASPVHFYRLRKRTVERGETASEVPPRFRYRRAGVVPEPESSGQDPEQNETGSGATFTDVLAELPEFVGQHAHAALVRAMEEQPPTYDGLDAFTRDRSDDPEETEMMRGICRTCPLLELCEAFALVGRPAAGMWPGMTAAEIRRVERAA